MHCIAPFPPCYLVWLWLRGTLFPDFVAAAIALHGKKNTEAGYQQ